MKDWFDLFQILLSMLKNPSTAWVVVLFLLWYIFRDRLKLFTDGVLNWIGVKFGGEMSFRRFEPTYRRCVRESHLYMQLVGIRTEGEQRPKITEAYVPIKLLPRGSGSGEALLIEEVILKYTHSLILGDPGAGKSTLLDFLTIKFSDLPKSPQHHFSFLSYLMFLNTRAMYPCPIYVHLRGCLPKNESLLDDILDPATHILPDVLPLAIRRRMPRQFIERCFKRKQALLLLDGLDEVADEQMYKSVTRKINGNSLGPLE